MNSNKPFKENCVNYCLTKYYTTHMASTAHKTEEELIEHIDSPEEFEKKV